MGCPNTEQSTDGPLGKRRGRTPVPELLSHCQHICSNTSPETRNMSFPTYDFLKTNFVAHPGHRGFFHISKIFSDPLEIPANSNKKFRRPQPFGSNTKGRVSSEHALGLSTWRTRHGPHTPRRRTRTVHRDAGSFIIPNAKYGNSQFSIFERPFICSGISFEAKFQEASVCSGLFRGFPCPSRS